MPQVERFIADQLEVMNIVLEAISGLLWHEYVLYAVLAIGVLFTIWSGFCQWRALTHGVQVVRGKFDDKSDPGAISHFQALSAALSATVGIGNIGGVAGAIAIGGPGAVFWMWVVGVVGMALKTTEVSLAMLYRKTDDPDNPHGGAMWVADQGFQKKFPNLWWLGKIIAVVFCITLIVATITGGNMAQAYNVAEATNKSFPGVPMWACGLVLALLCGLVIIGGIKVIGRVAGFIVPFMCVSYMIAGAAVLIVKGVEIPNMFGLIVTSAFSETGPDGGAFLGGTWGMAFVWGLKRAFFSSEAGQGSAPIAHSAAKTDEPVREGIVAGLEPFIDTIVVCTMTALIILLSGAWNREAEGYFPADETPPLIVSKIIDRETVEEYRLQAPKKEAAAVPAEKTKETSRIANTRWAIKGQKTPAPQRIATPWHDSKDWQKGEKILIHVRGRAGGDTKPRLYPYHGEINLDPKTKQMYVAWEDSPDFETRPELPREKKTGRYPVYIHYVAASLTAHAFDRVFPGLGSRLIPIAVWFFALSTVISWSYYGEQGMIYMFGMRSVMPYRIAYCVFILLATVGIITTERELANFTDLGTGLMLVANLPICLIFGNQTMRAYWDYMRRLRAGDFSQEEKP